MEDEEQLISQPDTEQEPPEPEKKKKRSTYKRKRGPKKKPGRKKKPNPVGRPPSKRKTKPKPRGRPKSRSPRKRISKNGTAYWIPKKKPGPRKKPGRKKKRGPKVNHRRRFWRKHRVRLNRERREMWRKMHPKPRGRKPKDWLSYEDAREAVRQERIPNVKSYRRWWMIEQPQRIPKFPERVYKEAFLGFNDWLGNNNEFKTVHEQKRYRTYREAAVFARALKLATRQEWTNYINDNLDTFPDDIPKRPDLWYKDWISWYHFLGKTPGERLQDLQEEQDPSVFYVYHEDGDPTNVYRFAIEPKGVGGILDKWKVTPSFKVARMYKYMKRCGPDIQHVLREQSTPYWGDENVRLVPNLPELLWRMSNVIPVVHPPK